MWHVLVKSSALVCRGAQVPRGGLPHTWESIWFDVAKIITPRYPSYGFLTSPEQAEALLFTCWDSLFLVSSQGVSCLSFYDFPIISHGSLRRLTATLLPAEFYIREWEEWIIKGSHLEIMKRNKMPMLIAQGAEGIAGRRYCYFLNIIVGWEMWFAAVRYTRRKPPGPQGHANKQLISTKHIRHGKHIYNEPLMDENRNTNAKGHSTEHTSRHFMYTHTI